MMESDAMRDEEGRLHGLIIGALVVGLGVFVPLLLLPFVYGFIGSEILEEVAKALVVIFLIARLSGGVSRIVWSGVFGFLFGVSETMLYLMPAVQTQLYQDFWTRFVTTVPLHTITPIIIMLPIMIFKSKWAGLLGLALALGFHLFFNLFIAVGL